MIDRQLEAYRDSVLDAHEEAMAAESVQDLLRTGIAVARLVVDNARQCRAACQMTPELAANLIEKCRTVLAVMVKGQRRFRVAKGSGHELLGEDEYQEAVLEVRELMTSLRDAVTPAGKPSPAPEAEQVRALEEFKQLASTHPPPQSWFEEDFRGLGGPDDL